MYFCHYSKDKFNLQTLKLVSWPWHNWQKAEKLAFWNYERHMQAHNTFKIDPFCLHWSCSPLTGHAVGDLHNTKVHSFQIACGECKYYTHLRCGLVSHEINKYYLEQQLLQWSSIQFFSLPGQKLSKIGSFKVGGKMFSHCPYAQLSQDTYRVVLWPYFPKWFESSL